MIDDHLPGRSPFLCQTLEIAGETLYFYHRDIIHCIQSLFADPDLARDLILAPERHYSNSQRTCRVYSDMHTGDWWWTVQVRQWWPVHSSTNQ